MFIYLFDRGDRLGANISNYLAQIFICHKNNYIIKFRDNSKENYRYSNSIFIKAIFNYIDKYNEELYKKNIRDDEERVLNDQWDLLYTTSFALQEIKKDYISYFYDHIYDFVKNDFDQLTNHYNIPFDVNKTILVHLRLDDTANWNDYDGSICSDYHRNRISNNECCHTDWDHLSKKTDNVQAPFSKEKIEAIINKAKEKFDGYKVILLTSPKSDTSFLDYEVIKNEDENMDLFLLTLCNVVILSRSNAILNKGISFE